MSKLNMKEWIGQTIQNKATAAIPIMTHPGIEFIGKTVLTLTAYFLILHNLLIISVIRNLLRWRGWRRA